MWDRLCNVLTDPEFLQARLGMSPRHAGDPDSTVHDLLEDYLSALDTVPAGHAGRQGMDCSGGRQT
jgi:hypothetical protein